MQRTCCIRNNVLLWTVGIYLLVSHSRAQILPLSADIGNVAAAGSALVQNGVYFVHGSGEDIWRQADEFQFVYQQVNGDTEIVAKILDQDNTHPWAKVGLMARETLDPGARNAMVFLTPLNGVGFQWRAQPGGNSQFTHGGSASAPLWLKVVRNGNTFTGYASVDGLSWWSIGSTTVAMSNSIFIGLAVTSHRDGVLGRGVFGEVNVALPIPWQNRDIALFGGSASFSNGVFYVTGGGADIWDLSDQFQYVYQSVTGDVSIVAEITSMLPVEFTRLDDWAKAGLMIRETLDANSRNAMVFLTPAHGAGFQWRATAGGASQYIPGHLVSAPVWLKLTRSGNTFTAYWSIDDHNWVFIGSTSLLMGGSVYVGLAVTGHSGSRAIAGFRNVAVTVGEGDPLPAPWQHQDVGNVAIAGNASYLSGAFLVQGSGADIWHTADAFHYAYRPWTGNGQITVQLTAIQNTDPWAKVGVMFRQSLGANAPNAFMMFTALHGTAFQTRVASGATTSYVPGPLTSGWLRLVRLGNVFTGYTSNDGMNWVPIGSQTISMPSSILVGLAVTSHNNAQLNTSMFQPVQVGP